MISAHDLLRRLPRQIRAAGPREQRGAMQKGTPFQRIVTGSATAEQIRADRELQRVHATMLDIKRREYARPEYHGKMRESDVEEIEAWRTRKSSARPVVIGEPVGLAALRRPSSN